LNFIIYLFFYYKKVIKCSTLVELEAEQKTGFTLDWMRSGDGSNLSQSEAKAAAG
jgi:hypothetical protein